MPRCRLRPLGRELAMHAILRTGCVGLGNRRAYLLAAAHPLKTQLAHQPLDRATGDFESFAFELLPHLVGAVDFEVRVVDAMDLGAQFGIAPRSGPKVRRRRDRQYLADRLDSVRRALLVDKRHHHFGRRSSSACTKYADALRRISLTCRSSRSNSLMRSSSAVVAPARWPRSFWSCRTHLRSVSGVQPTFAAIELMAAHSD